MADQLKPFIYITSELAGNYGDQSTLSADTAEVCYFNRGIEHQWNEY